MTECVLQATGRTATCLRTFVSHQCGRGLNPCCGEGDVGALRIVSCLVGIMSAADPLDRSAVDGGDVSVAGSVLLSAAVGVVGVSRVMV